MPSPKTEIGGDMGYFARVIDTEGNMIGLWSNKWNECYQIELEAVITLRKYDAIPSFFTRLKSKSTFYENRMEYLLNMSERWKNYITERKEKK
jgi:hypothetical protein